MEKARSPVPVQALLGRLSTAIEKTASQEGRFQKQLEASASKGKREA